MVEIKIPIPDNVTFILNYSEKLVKCKDFRINHRFFALGYVTVRLKQTIMSKFCGFLVPFIPKQINYLTPLVHLYTEVFK